MALSLGQFFLGLAADAKAAQTFRSSQAAARAQMDYAGIPQDVQDIVISGDAQQIAAAVNAGLGTPGPGAGVPVTIAFHIFGPPGPPPAGSPPPDP